MVNNLSFYDWVLIEKERLRTNAFPDFVENSYGENYIIECDGNVEEVRKLVKEVLLIFNELYIQNKWFDTVEEWKAILPHQFTQKFARELTDQEVEEYHNWFLSSNYKQKLKKAQREANEPWRLSSWVTMMDPIDRIWFWWGDTIFGQETKDDYFLVSVKLLDDYYSFSPIEAFFINCGAKSVSMYPTTINL